MCVSEECVQQEASCWMLCQQKQQMMGIRAKVAGGEGGGTGVTAEPSAGHHKDPGIPFSVRIEPLLYGGALSWAPEEAPTRP